MRRVSRVPAYPFRRNIIGFFTHYKSQSMRTFPRLFSTWGFTLLWVILGGHLMAQSEIALPGPGSLTTAYGAEQMDAPFVSSVEPGDSPEAMWDQQFAHNITATPAGVGNAGAVFVNGEFWVARWQTDTLFRFQADGTFIGAFQIPSGGSTLSGTRAMTTDGTDVFIANNTTTIYRIDTATRTILGTIPSPIGATRFLTYDSLANAGNGGFWVGNFNTAITLISRTGTTLQTIAATTHGLGGMYGAAVDNFSTGGPYLWVFHQSNGPSQATISQLQLPAGTPTGVLRDVFADLGGNTGLAGGLFIADDIVPGEATLGGVIQGNPSNFLFGYELDFSPIQNDIGLTGFDYPLGLSQLPERLIQPILMGASTFNFGANPADTLNITLEVHKNGSLFYTDTRTQLGVTSGATNNVTFIPFTPDSQGTYQMTAYVSVPGVTDENPANDTLRYTLQVGESTVARDDDVHNGSAGYLVSSTNTAYAVVMHTFPVVTPLAGVEIEVETPQHGDTTYAVVVASTGGAPLGAPFELGVPIILDSNINDYYLPFSSLVYLPPGTFGIGVYEEVAGIFLRQSANIFTPGVNFFSTDLSNWTASGIPTARFIRPRLADCADFVLGFSTTPDNGSSNGTATVTGISGPVTILWDDPANQISVQAVGLPAGTYNVTVTDSVGCIYTASVEVPVCANVTLDLSSTPDNGTGNGSASVTPPAGSATFLWNDPSGQTGSTAVGLSAGIYTVTVTDSLGCSYTDSVEVLSNVSIGAALAGIDHIQMFPNPNQGQVNLHLDLRQAQSVQLRLYDLRGQTLQAWALPVGLRHRESLDLQALPAGTYLLEVRTPQGSVMQPLVRQ